MTQLGVSHRTAAAAIFYFLREHFNIHDLDFKMWCDEIGLPSSFTARKLDKQHRRVTQLSATQVGHCCGWLRRGAALRAPPPPACPLASDSCVRSGSLSPGRGIASHCIELHGSALKLCGASLGSDLTRPDRPQMRSFSARGGEMARAPGDGE
jgi:hypothetical protein